MCLPWDISVTQIVLLPLPPWVHSHCFTCAAWIQAAGRCTGHFLCVWIIFFCMIVVNAEKRNLHGTLWTIFRGKTNTLTRTMITLQTVKQWCMSTMFTNIIHLNFLETYFLKTSAFTHMNTSSSPTSVSTSSSSTFVTLSVRNRVTSDVSSILNLDKTGRKKQKMCKTFLRWKQTQI